MSSSLPPKRALYGPYLYASIVIVLNVFDYRLHVASEDYHRRLIKKAPCEALEDTEKYSAIDALGIVMIQHGEEFGGDSAFGTSPMT